MYNGRRFAPAEVVVVVPAAVLVDGYVVLDVEGFDADAYALNISYDFV